MTPNEKALILKELCARLPYGIYVEMYSFSEKRSVKLESIDISDDDYLIINETWWLKDEYPKPFLRPMSSMTEKEKEEYKSFSYLVEMNNLPNYKADMIEVDICYELVDWFHINNFDYRGLIEKGLAINYETLESNG